MNVNTSNTASIQDEAWANQYVSKCEAFWHGEAKALENVTETLTLLGLETK